MCSLHSNGSLHTGSADTDGVIFPRARRRKERRCPELVGPGSRARLVVLALDVGGRWSAETRHSSLSWRRQKTRTASPAEEGRAGLEDEVGPSSLAQLRRQQSQHVSWASDARMGHSSQFGRWRLTTSTPGWLRESFS